MSRKQVHGKAVLENLPISVLVAGINNSLSILQKRGVPVSDWDQKKRKLYGLKIFGGRAYFLAAETEQEGGADGKRQTK